jgi:hypothetical protein
VAPGRSQAALKLLQGHIGYITSRVNTITGVAYKDDPTIMGYNLFNEPRWAQVDRSQVVSDHSDQNEQVSSLL